jgi:hypothetical protein
MRTMKTILKSNDRKIENLKELERSERHQSHHGWRGPGLFI